jgi:hypothetical protein
MFNVGDYVYSENFGIGRITNIYNLNQKDPIKVYFYNFSSSRSYTLNGIYSIDSNYPTSYNISPVHINGSNTSQKEVLKLISDFDYQIKEYNKLLKYSIEQDKKIDSLNKGSIRPIESKSL